MFKYGYGTELTYNISEEELQQAKKAIDSFEDAVKAVKIAKEHLNIMYNPFKDNPSISTDQIIKYRAALRRFRDKSIDNFNEVKVKAFRCVSLIQVFSSDTQISKLMKSFISSMESIEKEVNNFAYVFFKLKSNTFVQDVVSAIEKVQKECDKLISSIEDRIKSYIQSNIIGDVWVKNMEDKLNEKIENKKPVFMQINNKTKS